MKLLNLVLGETRLFHVVQIIGSEIAIRHVVHSYRGFAEIITIERKFALGRGPKLWTTRSQYQRLNPELLQTPHEPGQIRLRRMHVRKVVEQALRVEQS